MRTGKNVLSRRCRATRLRGRPSGRRLTAAVGLLLALTLVPYSPARAQTAPSITVNDVTVAERDARTMAITVVISLSSPASQAVTVDYTTVNGSAVASADYQPTSGTLRFAPGETSKTVAVKVKGDTIPEGDEIFYVQLTEAANATISDPQGSVTIVDDDRLVSVSDVRVAEPVPGAIEVALFQVTLSGPTDRALSVDFETVDGSAVAGQDYVPVTGTLTFRPGEAAKTIAVDVKNDLVAAADERFYLRLFNPSHGELARAVGEAIIINLDRALLILDTAVLEPDPGARRLAIFDVQVSLPTSDATFSSGFPGQLPITVDFATADGTAIAGLDYEPTSGTLEFPPGVASRQIAVPVLNDNVAGGGKRFTVNLFNPRNAPLADSSGAAFIAENDATMTIEDTSVLEGDAAGAVATFVVSLSAALPIPVTVRYATEPATAAPGEDYVPQTGAVTFGPGEVSHTVTVPIVGDVVDESETPETFLVTLDSPDGLRLARPRATGSIVDDDFAVSIVDPTVTEGDEGTVDATFTVSLSSVRGLAVEVDYTTADGTAAAPADYTPRAGTLVFAPYESSKTITVPVVGDLLAEPDETFSVRLTRVVGAELARADASATILASDDGYWLAASDGGVFAFGDARFLGSTGAMRLNARIVGLAATPTGNGYWLAGADGGIFAFGDAGFLGSAGGIRRGPQVVAMAGHPTQTGYWLAYSNGAVAALGAAGRFGSAAVRPGTTIVGMAPTPTGNGYWLAASDGGVFAFGDARFLGSAGTVALNAPVVGIAATPTGNGYWLIGADGGVFSFGDAGFWGSTGGQRLNRPVIGLTPTLSGNGYWLVAADGGIFAFGDAPFRGSTGAIRLNHPIVAMAPLTGRVLPPARPTAPGPG